MKNKLKATIFIAISLFLLSACKTQVSDIETPTLEVPSTKSLPTASPTPTAETPTEIEVITPEGLLPAPIIYLGVEDQPEPVAPGKQNLWRLEADSKQIAYGSDGIRLISAISGEARLILENEPQNLKKSYY